MLTQRNAIPRLSRSYFARRAFNNSSCRKEHKELHEHEEIIEGVFLFHRHGDRTPVKSLVADAYAEEEALFWKTKIPPPQYCYEMLSERFPVNTQFNSFKDTDDEDNESYGFLTWKGMHQMYYTGVAMAARYGSNNICDDDPSS